MGDLTVEIVGGLIVALIGFVAYRVYQSRSSSVDSFLTFGVKKNLSEYLKQPSFEDLIQGLRILIIDDEDIASVKTFRENGYNVEKWDKVKSMSDLSSGKYDIIVLDINGVATHLSDEDGFGVLKELKRYDSNQVVIAFSAKSYDLSKQEFFKLADDTIYKPSSFLKMKEKIDNLIQSELTLNIQIEKIRNTLLGLGYTISTWEAVEVELCKSLHNKVTIDYSELLSFMNNQDEKNKVERMIKRVLKRFKK